MSNVNVKGDVNPLFYAISGIKTYSDYGESTYIFTRIKNCNLWAASGKMFLHKEKASSHWLVTDFYSEPNIDMETCQVSSTKKKTKTNSGSCHFEAPTEFFSSTKYWMER